MNASSFMDKQIMDLSRSSSNNNKNSDFIDLMNPQSEPQLEDHLHHQQHLETNNNNNGGLNNNKQDILPNYDFQPIHRPTFDHNPTLSSNKPLSSPPTRSYSSFDHVEPDKIVLEKAERVNDSVILSEIDGTMKKHTDALMHAIESLSARLSQMESRTRQVEHSVDDLKVAVGNNHGSADGKLRQLENILLEVKTGVQNLKDRQEVFEGHMQLAKLQTSKSELSSDLPNSANQVPVPQATASAPPQQSGFQQFPAPVPQPLPSMASPPSQQNIHPPLPMTSQFSLATTPPGPHRDPYLPPANQTPDASSQQYQIPPPVQNQQPTPPAPHPQQYQQAPTPPYPQPPQPPQQHHPSVMSGNAPPQFQPSLGPMGHRQDDSPYAPPPTYPPSHYQPASQPGSGPPHYGSPSLMYEPPPPPARSGSGSGFQSSYVPPSGSSETFSYGGPTPHYGGAPSIKQQPHSPRGGTGSYPQLPTARVLPQAIPTAAGVGGGSSSGGNGNKVPIDDVVDKVTNMGFSRDQVRATVRRLTENGQSVDLNIVLDKLMNDADVQPPKGWFGR